MAVLMGFGSEWRLPKGSRNAQRGVGNALCVAMSKAIVQAAVALRAGAPAAPPPLATAVPPAAPQPSDPPALAEQPRADRIPSTTG